MSQQCLNAHFLVRRRSSTVARSMNFRGITFNAKSKKTSEHKTDFVKVENNDKPSVAVVSPEFCAHLLLSIQSRQSSSAGRKINSSSVFFHRNSKHETRRFGNSRLVDLTKRSDGLTRKQKTLHQGVFTIPTSRL